MTTKAVPTLHHNGSGFEHLATALREAKDAVSNALEKLAKCSPHDRDYYVQPYVQPKIDHLPASMVAIQEHYERRKKLEEVYNDLVVLLDKLIDADDERKSRRASFT